MKNNELTEVKAAMPSLEGLPQEVIEYVHGLVAENAALKRASAEGQKWDGEQWIGLSIETPATDAFTAELRAQGVDALALHMEFNGYSNEASGAREYAANLRAGRKG